MSSPRKPRIRRGPFVALVAVSLLLVTGIAGADDGYEFDSPVYGFDIARDGTLLVPEGNAVWEIKHGRQKVLNSVDDLAPSYLQDVAAVGKGSVWATSLGLDLAEKAGVYRLTRGEVELVGDIEAFETTHDPDAFEGPMWKTQACEESPDFSAGPQSNPYHLELLSGDEALVGDAAGNTLLSVDGDGGVDWVAVFTPPTADGSGSTNPDDWLVLFPLDAETDCYVQPVPTAVTVGPDGAYYVGELIGFNFGAEAGLSRVWRIEAGAMNATCPGPQCEVVLSGLTSIVDVEFGPDGHLYVTEFDRNGWLNATEGDPDGGQVSRCDVVAGTCEVVVGGAPFSLFFPGDVEFDHHGGMWLLENTFAPVIHQVNP